MTKVIDLTEKTFKAEVIESTQIVLVDFWAPWCGPCKMMTPVLEALSEEFEGKVKIAKLDVEVAAHQDLAQQYQIQSIPNMKIFKDGKIIKEVIGFKSKEELKKELESLF